MSYIRSTTNPEHLYIFHDGKNIEIIKGSDYPLIIPPQIFKGLMVKYLNEGHDESVEFENAKLSCDTDFKWTLAYGNWKINMWEVTLEYIARAVVHQGV